MIIDTIECKIKKEKISSYSEERIVSFKLAVTLKDGDNKFIVYLHQDIDEIENSAIKNLKEIGYYTNENGVITFSKPLT